MNVLVLLSTADADQHLLTLAIQSPVGNVAADILRNTTHDCLVGKHHVILHAGTQPFSISPL